LLSYPLDTYNKRHREEETTSWQTKSRLSFYNKEEMFGMSGEDSIQKSTSTSAEQSRADLTEATLSRADLYEANLSDATLTGATLTEATLRGADLSRANLRYATLTQANLYGALQLHLFGGNLH